MENAEISKKVKDVMSRVFELKVEDINEDASSNTVENWDSLQHMNLIIALEDEFNIQFRDNQVAELLSYSIIVDALNQIVQ